MDDLRSTDVGDIPIVARWGTTHPAAPLVVVLHGNGTSEHSVIELSPWLPHGPVAYVAVRAPILRNRGYWWYVDGGQTLDTTCRWLLDWLAGEGDPERPVLLVGFREGVTIAGALLLTAPERFAAGVLLYGALPFAGMPTGVGRLVGLPVFLAHGSDDTRTPTDQLERTWNWLIRHSGAPVWAERVPGGRQLAGDVVGQVGTWLGDRLDHIRAHGESPLPDGDEPRWPGLGRLPRRAGDPPEVTAGTPQHQVSQNAPPDLAEQLWARVSVLATVTTGPTKVGVEGTRALLLDRAGAAGPDAAFLLPDDGEFGHQHPDGSLHVALADALAYDALAKGWAVAHPLAGVRLARGIVLVPGPRDEAELEIVTAVVAAAHAHARGVPN